MRKIVTLVYALIITSCWAQKPISDSTSYGACIVRDGSVSAVNQNERFPAAIPADARIVHKTGTGFPSAEGVQDMNDAGIILMPDGSHVIIAIFTKQSSSEAVIVNIAKQLLERIR